jgi:hypothetical protein
MGWVWIGWIGFIDHLHTPLGTTLHGSLAHTNSWLQSVTVSTSRFLTTDVTQWRLLSFLHSGLLSQLPMQNSCWLTTQVIGSLADGHFTPTSYLLITGWLPTDNWTLSLINQLHHVTSLNWTGDNSPPTINSLLQTVLFITSWHGPNRKHSFHCYSPTIPYCSMETYLFIQVFYSNGCSGCPVWGLCPATGLYATLFSSHSYLAEYKEV